MKTFHPRNARNIRENQGLSQRQLAEIMQVDRSLISHFEAGRAHISVKRLVRMADALSVSMELLLQDAPSPTEQVPEVA